MRSVGCLVILGLLGVCLGQGYGGMQAGGEVVWTEDYSHDNMGSSPFIVSSDSGQHNPAFYRELPATTRAPPRGIGGTHGAQTNGEGESWSPHVAYNGQHFVAEKEEFSILCTLTLFDQLKWTHNGKPVVPGEGGYSMTEVPGDQGFIKSRLSVANAHMYHAGEYKCTTFSPRSHTVYVLSADLTGGETIQMMYVGYPLKLTCNMTNHENTSFELNWFINNVKVESNVRIKIFKENSSLVINSPVKTDVGDYKCQTLPGIPSNKSLSKVFKVIYFEIRKMDKSANVDMEKSLELECPVEGSPHPVITWKKDGKPIADSINETRITYSPNEKEVPYGKIVITNAGWSDRGNYTCVINTLSNDFERYTFIRVKDVYAALWPFIGIVVEVLLLGIIIFIFEKRRAKAEFEESDTDPGNDQKNTTDLDKDSVRQRK